VKDPQSKTTRLPTRPPPQERMLVVGDGPVARALAVSLERAGARLERWWRRRGGALPACDVAVLAVRDEAIGQAAAHVMASLARDATPPILLHCAGALPAEESFRALKPRPLGVGLVHPLRSLAGQADDADLAGTIFAVEGDATGLDAALRLVALLGGRPLELEAGQLARYHAACVLVSNHAVALVSAGVELLGSVGLPPDEAARALASLLASTADNLRSLGLPQALTGPIARGDVAVVARHLVALQGWPEIASLYRVTGRRVTSVAASKGTASADAVARLRALLIGD
jgi:predicted short-subunit dehydrogenase-like oxidoreductase (DUF2520 family)